MNFEASQPFCSARQEKQFFILSVKCKEKIMTDLMGEMATHSEMSPLFECVTVIIELCCQEKYRRIRATFSDTGAVDAGVSETGRI